MQDDTDAVEVELLLSHTQVLQMQDDTDAVEVELLLSHTQVLQMQDDADAVDIILRRRCRRSNLLVRE